MAADRVRVLAQQLAPLPAAAAAAPAKAPKADDDVVIVAAVRTAITRARRGAFKDTLPEELLKAVLEAVVKKAGVPAGIVQDIQVGCVLPPGGGAAISRMAMLAAGFPEQVTIGTLNRQCSSGLQAVANVAAAIKAGYIDIGIGAGFESMTKNSNSRSRPSELSADILATPAAADCLLPMGITSENVAERFGVDRTTQDKLAVLSNERALRAPRWILGSYSFVAAQKNNLFTEIIPVTTKVLDADGKEKTVTVTKDEGPRPNTTLEALARLPSSFKEGGASTAGNSSQVSDGAAAVLLMRRSKAKELGLKPLARFVTMAVVGVEPAVMGIGPAVAIPKALQQAGLTKDEIDVFELNEAFASQAAYCVRELKLDPERVNPLGGAIALGHPLGCTGARQIATLLPELERRNGKYGVISMCIGTGMGAAAVIQRE